MNMNTPTMSKKSDAASRRRLRAQQIQREMAKLEMKNEGGGTTTVAVTPSTSPKRYRTPPQAMRRASDEKDVVFRKPQNEFPSKKNLLEMEGEESSLLDRTPLEIKGRRTWSICIDTPGGHGPRLTIVEGIETPRKNVIQKDINEAFPGERQRPPMSPMTEPPASSIQPGLSAPDTPSHKSRRRRHAASPSTSSDEKGQMKQSLQQEYPLSPTQQITTTTPSRRKQHHKHTSTTKRPPVSPITPSRTEGQKKVSTKKLEPPAAPLHQESQQQVQRVRPRDPSARPHTPKLPTTMETTTTYEPTFPLPQPISMLPHEGDLQWDGVPPPPPQEQVVRGSGPDSELLEGFGARPRLRTAIRRNQFLRRFRPKPKNMRHHTNESFGDNEDLVR